MAQNRQKLAANQRHLLFLIEKETEPDGWATVGEAVWTLVVELPEELVDTWQNENGSFARLTSAGKTVLKWT